MKNVGKILEISEKELEMLEAWQKHGTLSEAARALGIPQSTISNRKSRLQWRYHRARDFIREVERWMAKLPGALE